MIYGGVLNAMTEDELRNYARHLQDTLSGKCGLVGAKAELADAWKNVVYAMQFNIEARDCDRNNEAELRDLTRYYEEKYKDLMPKPMTSVPIPNPPF